MSAKPQQNTTNPTKDLFTPKELQRLALSDPVYYQYITDPANFDYSMAPSGVNVVDPKGKHNQFTVNWDVLTKSYRDQQAADAAAKKTADEAAAAAKRQTQISTARGLALKQAQQFFQSQGLNPNDYAADITGQIDDLLSTLPDGVDPSSVINGSVIGSNILSGKTSAARSQYSNLVSSDFGPNYGNKLIDDHLLDSTIASILGEQKTGAETYLEAGKKRGIYNDIGYQRGQQLIGDDTSAGDAQLHSLGQGVLGKYRTEANTVGANAASAASNYVLGQSPFNVDEYLSQGNAIKDRATQYGGGDLRTALGGQNFFDLSALNQGAGQAQGAVNLQDTDLVAALAARKKQNDAARGLNSQGAF